MDSYRLIGDNEEDLVVPKCVFQIKYVRQVKKELELLTV
jgi:hypothetical protein